MLSILMAQGLACDHQDEDPEARLVECGVEGFRALPGECPCDAGLRSLAGDCVPDDRDPGEPGDDPDECRRDGTNCDDDDDDDDDDGGGEEPAACGYRTHTQAGWGGTCIAQSPGCYRDAHFEQSFPEGLYVGCGVLTANLTNSLAVELALPASGSPRALLPAEAVGYDGVGDPQVETELFGQVAALSLSVAFDQMPDYDDLDQPISLANLLIADPGSLCAGMFVYEVLEQANYALGGCPSQLSAAAANDCVAAINASYVDAFDTCSAVFAAPPPL
ncbi:MAG: hypothetical protein H0T76_24065 [Nannocystis sp.]|nr:hypothetical protein [Nannocystis sp.]MBA3549564.1 hypothetical protein [Nannocystis sp.]